jgi:hypothetical protein
MGTEYNFIAPADAGGAERYVKAFGGVADADYMGNAEKRRERTLEVSKILLLDERAAAANLQKDVAKLRFPSLEQAGVIKKRNVPKTGCSHGANGYSTSAKAI